MTEDNPQWKETLGLADDSTRVQIICKEEHKEEWTIDAKNQGYSSRSSYLYELIEEARSYREDGFLGWEQAQERIESQEAEIERLEEELEDQREANETTFGNTAAVKRQLSRQFKSLDKIIRQFIEEEDLESVLQPAIEDTLYGLADQNEIEYQRGHGWCLSEGGDE
jgi:DNA polymerase II small subunit/DNA polymerase delta subunit B